ncbi:hypothetical protein PilKf_00516 [Pillotina sp. SPG140]|jgi:hypothetical protein
MPLLKRSPYHRFVDFVSVNSDRYRILREVLSEMRVNYQIVTINGHRHFLLFPGRSLRNMRPDLEYQLNGAQLLRFDLLKNRLIGDIDAIALMAHYDRYEGSPGANDNSAAVFQLIEAASYLQKEQINRWLIILTDKEELAHGEGICDQGAYSLAKGLCEAGFNARSFFIFDACGTGDTVIISTVADRLFQNNTNHINARLRHTVRKLRNDALYAARNVFIERITLTATPFSDDVGFFRAGIAAQTITMLPATEASQVTSLIRSKPDLAHSLINNTYNRDWIPPTWQRLNSSDDTITHLTPQHFSITVRFAQALCSGKMY